MSPTPLNKLDMNKPDMQTPSNFDMDTCDETKITYKVKTYAQVAATMNSENLHAEESKEVAGSDEEEDVEDTVDWMHIPTKSEVTELLNRNLFYVSLAELERPDVFNNVSEFNEDYKESIQGRIKTLADYSVYSILFSENTSEPIRLAESKIRKLYCDYMNKTFAVETQIWTDLAQQLTQEEWDDLWQHMPIYVRYETNWIYFLYSKQVKVENAKAEQIRANAEQIRLELELSEKLAAENKSDTKAQDEIKAENSTEVKPAAGLLWSLLGY